MREAPKNREESGQEEIEKTPEEVKEGFEEDVQIILERRGGWEKLESEEQYLILEIRKMFEKANGVISEGQRQEFSKAIKRIREIRETL